MDEAANLVKGDAAVAEDLVDARIDGDDAIERARMRVAVELDEDGALVHNELPREDVVCVACPRLCVGM
jgi:hypothetical protein